MNNIAQIKKQVKAHIKKEDLGNTAFLTINFDDVTNEKCPNTYKLTKNQYLQTELSSLIKKDNLKFPLTTKQFNSQESLQKHIAVEKNSISLVKLNNYLVLNKKTVSSLALTTNAICYKLTNSMLNMVKLLKLLKHLGKNNENTNN